MSRIAYPLLNTIAFLATLFVNYWVNSGALNGKTVGQISNQYDTLFTPAGYAFSIWGIIYLLIAGFIGYQWYNWATGKGYDARKSGLLLPLANVLNGLWVFAWISELTGLSVIVMVLLLFTLTELVVRLDMERWDAPTDVLVFVWWPIALYLGWIILATVANIAAFLTKMDWVVLFSPEVWTVVMIGIAASLYLYLIWTRNLREASVAGMWGLFAVYVKQQEAFPGIAYVALGACLVIGLFSAIQVYQNRRTLPGIRKYYESQQ